MRRTNIPGENIEASRIKEMSVRVLGLGGRQK